MPRTPGITLFPNSAPDSFTPKNLNFVVAPGQRELAGGEGADDVVVGVDGVEEGADVAVDGKHWK